ncbi:MAG: discoidin domain-containing protein [Chitinophagales bacterium]|nr:discoidin domain-containing protein [Chitinophagales bacterium]
MKKIILFSFWLLAFHFSLLFAQTSGRTTYCNPMDINYQYNWEQINEKISYRSGADPVIVNHDGEYFLFVTISGGYWKSKDLLHWEYVVPSKWPMEDICAPAALSVRDTLYLFQSTFDQRPIFYSTKPETGDLKFYNRWLPQLPKEVGPWDPDIFYDQDKDKWYMYWGSSNVYPIYGCELDKSNRLTYKGDYKEMIRLHPDQHGWERFGQDHRDSTVVPYIEGAWMNKYNGKYFLQYGAPGTEYNVYANGTYVGTDPLGPFTYAPYNPIAYKPGGFMQGAGHGCTFKDNYGNYWNMGTPWVAVNWNFERRISMFPAGFNKDDELYSDSRFGDFPHFLPTKKWESADELFTGWMLLSYKKPCTASSSNESYSDTSGKFSSVIKKSGIQYLTDENPRSFWLAAKNQPGEWAIIDLQKEYEVKALQVNYTDYQSGIFESNESVYTQFKMYESKDGKNWNLIVDLTKEKSDRPNAYIELNEPVKTRYIKYEHVYVAAKNLAISDIRVFGIGDGKIPDTPKKFSVKRETDQRNAMVSWEKVKDAVGYNIRWGIGKDKLYQTYQVWGDQPSTLEVRALNIGQDYWFAIEAFDENGVSKLSEAVHVN